MHNAVVQKDIKLLLKLSKEFPYYPVYYSLYHTIKNIFWILKIK